MRLRFSYSVVLLVALGPVGSRAALAFQSAGALIDAIYTPLLAGEDAPAPQRLYCADTLKRLRALEARDPMGLDFSPFVDGQDWELTDLRKMPRRESADRVEMAVSFRNSGRPTTLVYDLRREGSRWCVYDIRGGQGRDAWSVRRLAAP